ncbi:MAG: DUF5671 domain-containing protein [Patescibacteria group bacterium]
MSANNHAKYAFFYILALIALAFTGIGLGQIAFQIINFNFPETTFAYSSGYLQEILRMGVAFVVVAAPIYYGVTRQINKELAAGRMNQETGVRRWLTYLILLAASGTAIGFLIGFLLSFLEGELTVKFALKVASVLLITGGFGFYYTYDLRRQNLVRDIRVRLFGAVLGVVVIAALVGAFTIMDSPFRARELREDQERVNDLNQIKFATEQFNHLEGRLPESLAELVEGQQLRESDTQDPISDAAYIYRVLADREYELCATFTHSNLEEDLDERQQQRFVDAEWMHSAGEHCFSKKVESLDEELLLRLPRLPELVPAEE